jgi:hypothetical protein
LLAELHDVYTFLAQRRTDRGRGICLAGFYLQFDVAVNFLGHVEPDAVLILMRSNRRVIKAPAQRTGGALKISQIV